MEIWKDIPNYEGIYQVSNLGNVKRLQRKTIRSNNANCLLKEKELSKCINTGGYYYVLLYKDYVTKNKPVHQLVAMAFLGHIPNGSNKIVVDHINNDKLDNRIENLQVISNRENTSKDKKNKTSKYTGVSLHKVSKKWRAEIKVNGVKKLLGYFKTEYEANLEYQKELKLSLQN